MLRADFLVASAPVVLVESVVLVVRPAADVVAAPGAVSPPGVVQNGYLLRTPGRRGTAI